MGRARKWLRSFFARKKAKEKAGDSTPNWPRETKEKRWSFRRSMGASKDLNSTEPSFSEPCYGFLDSEFDQKRHAMAVAVATAAAAEAAVVAAQAAAAVVRLTAKPNDRKTSAIEEISAIKIQSFFRSYLARKALNALKGLVKMQALVRGHLVRKQATTILRCMQVLVNAQDRARAERIRLVQDPQSTPLRLQNYRRSSPHHSFELDLNEEEHVKIVEMDLGGRTHQKFSANNSTSRRPCKADLSPHFSPNPMDFEEFLFTTSQNSPQLSAMSMPAHTSFDHYPLYPNYMANTESSRAKLRSQSAPKQRLEAYERQSSKRRQSMEGRNVQRGIRMQRSSSSSHVGFVANSYEYT